MIPRNALFGALGVLLALAPTLGATAAAQGAAPEAGLASAEERQNSVASTVRIGSATIRYRTTAGTLTLRDDAGNPTASMFYVAYVADRPKGQQRPLTFLFNGGPGSASLWLNVGGFGPLRAPANAPHAMTPAPYRFGPNPGSILDKTDLVFLDAVGTGYSRALDGIDPKRFWGVDQDLDAFTRAITRYITINDRWNAPKFLFGESYGTTRAAGLALKLHNQGIDLNGVVLLSTILNFSDTLPGLDQGDIGILPTFAATAWYHDRVPDKPAALAPFLDEVRAFAGGPYARALAKGDTISAQEEEAVAQQVARYTGLPVDYIKASHLRIDMERFRSALLRDKGEIIGRFDSRFVGAASQADEGVAVDPATNDPATAGVSSALVATYRDYLSATVGFHSDLHYRALYNAVIEPAWDLHHRAPGYGSPLSSPNTALDLASAMRGNPTMQVLAMNGLFDMATPFFQTEYDVAHMGLAGGLRSNIRFGYYATGHMAYVDGDALAQMKRDLDAFYDRAAPPR
ncbi:S10 family peptidase [Sphingomonas sp. MMS12-HWE2-04]|uniref:S10 family peptidase n=1 Tax=Sphingomonas sp. MMS12-HWE2-04 TaxID=3234199 RepID=UPI0038509D93